ncbi:MAG: Gfo/Idh/MocA family oxidoreductase [Trueperaceae bacterium]|nr:MAG: Gfo/Idh/MocA family oxidoreductase [Trueperaceae bacterium]
MTHNATENQRSALSLAVVGAGLIGRSHIDTIERSRHCVLSAVVDTSPQARSASGKRVPLFSTLEDLLSVSRPDGIIIATPNSVHVEQGLACLEAGIPCLIEKPVAETVDEGLELLEAETRSGIPILIGHHRAHSPIMLEAQRIVESGRLGTLVAVSGHATFYKPDSYFDAAPWRTKPGGGPILINLIHEVHNLRMLCGEIHSVQALASNETRNFPVEDTVAIILRFESGALGTFLLSDAAASAKSWEQTSLENRSYAAYPEEDCYHLAGTLGSLDVPTMRLRTYPGERSWWQPFDQARVPLERSDPLEAQLEHFCAVIRHQVEPRVSVRDGLENLKVIEAIAEAAAAGTRVPLAHTR